MYFIYIFKYKVTNKIKRNENEFLVRKVQTPVPGEVVIGLLWQHGPSNTPQTMP